jgi:hypothetical protein
MRKLVALNENGRRVGESHPRAGLTDDEVELVHKLREQGLSLAQIATKMEQSKACIQKICDGSRRGQTVARVVSVSVKL